MYEVDFSKPIHIHFIGIGGISMSGLAEILLKESFTISGSDAKESDLTRHLTSLGAQVFYGQKAENILPGTDLVVYTAAIHPDNPEFAAAKAAGVPMLTRAELLGQIMRNYDTPIAVSGTHGKTTTTSMLSHILMAADCDPTISVRRYSSVHRRKYPCRPFRNLPDRGMRVYQQFLKLLSENRHYPQHGCRPSRFLQGYRRHPPLFPCVCPSAPDRRHADYQCRYAEIRLRDRRSWL